MHKTAKYLLITFALAWALQLISVFTQTTLLNSIVMLMPMLAVWLVSGGLKKEKSGVDWKFKLRGNLKYYLLAWWSPLFIMLTGATLYFLLFPARFDPGCGFLVAQLPELAATPMPAHLLVILQTASGMLYGPFINMLFAVGEEAGWRGYLTPALTARYGKRKALVLSGCIWGAWHWPLIILTGYQYGVGYWGFPVTGMLCMLLFTTAFGIFLSWLYEKSGNIWPCALCHGAANAIAGAPLYFLPAGATSYLLGPTFAGLIGGIPLLLLAAYLLTVKGFGANMAGTGFDGETR
ncbi:MAG: CPBP family intramembrane metalloprotease [Oscillospiraceae bacterium]|nr:CPBP family intramembrane metalloprotease [Oscillospiraceae bacterium]